MHLKKNPSQGFIPKDFRDTDPKAKKEARSKAPSKNRADQSNEVNAYSPIDQLDSSKRIELDVSDLAAEFGLTKPNIIAAMNDWVGSGKDFYSLRADLKADEVSPEFWRLYVQETGTKLTEVYERCRSMYSPPLVSDSSVLGWINLALEAGNTEEVLISEINKKCQEAYELREEQAKRQEVKRIAEEAAYKASPQFVLDGTKWHEPIYLAIEPKCYAVLKDMGLPALMEDHYLSCLPGLFGRKLHLVADHDAVSRAEAYEFGSKILIDASKEKDRYINTPFYKDIEDISVSIIDVFKGEFLPEFDGKGLSDYAEMVKSDKSLILQRIKECKVWDFDKFKEVDPDKWEMTVTRGNTIDGKDRKDLFEFLLDEVLPVNQTALLSGVSGSGKSHLCAELAAAVSNGTPFMGIPTKKGNVFYATFQEEEDAIKLRVRNADGDNSRFIVHASYGPPNVERFIEELQRTVMTHEISLVIVDMLQDAVLASNTNAYVEMHEKMKHLARFARKAGCAVVVAHHDDKAGNGSGGSEVIKGGGDVYIHLSGKGTGMRKLEIPKFRVGTPQDPVTLSFTKSGRLVPAGEMKKAADRDKDTNLLAQFSADRWLKRSEVQGLTNYKYRDNWLAKMVKAKKLEKTGGRGPGGTSYRINSENNSENGG